MRKLYDLLEKEVREGNIEKAVWEQPFPCAAAEDPYYFVGIIILVGVILLIKEYNAPPGGGTPPEGID
jgi:hypothetical protein